MILRPRKVRDPNETYLDNDLAAEESKGKKGKLTVLVDHRGIKVGAIVTLASGRNIRLSMDEAMELRNLISTLN